MKSSQSTSNQVSGMGFVFNHPLVPPFHSSRLSPPLSTLSCADKAATARSELRLYLGDLWERLGEERGNEFFYYLSKAPAERRLRRGAHPEGRLRSACLYDMI